MVRTSREGPYSCIRDVQTATPGAPFPRRSHMLLAYLPTLADPLDVAWVATPHAAAAAALTWIGVNSSDTVFELGCGDGRVALEAVNLGAQVVCVEHDDALAAEAERLLSSAGSRGRVVRTDLFDVDLSHASVVFLFLNPFLNAALRAKLDASLRPGARVLSRSFEIAGWPCGERFRWAGWSDFAFLKWVTPVESTSQAEDVDAAAHVEEHLLECASREELMDEL